MFLKTDRHSSAQVTDGQLAFLRVKHIKVEINCVWHEKRKFWAITPQRKWTSAFDPFHFSFKSLFHIPTGWEWNSPSVICWFVPFKPHQLICTYLNWQHCEDEVCSTVQFVESLADESASHFMSFHQCNSATWAAASPRTRMQYIWLRPSVLVWLCHCISFTPTQCCCIKPIVLWVRVDVNNKTASCPARAELDNGYQPGDMRFA